jgi:hypothetical protein
MKADPEHGDVEIELATDTGERRKFVLRPSFAAIVEIEEQTGESIFVLARRLSRAEMGQRDAAHIVAAGLKAAGETASHATVGEMIARSGLADVLAALGDFFGKFLGGYESAEAASQSEVERVT